MSAKGKKKSFRHLSDDFDDDEEEIMALKDGENTGTKSPGLFKKTRRKSIDFGSSHSSRGGGGSSHSGRQSYDEEDGGSAFLSHLITPKVRRKSVDGIVGISESNLLSHLVTPIKGQKPRRKSHDGIMTLRLDDDDKDEKDNHNDDGNPRTVLRRPSMGKNVEARDRVAAKKGRVLRRPSMDLNVEHEQMYREQQAKKGSEENDLQASFSDFLAPSSSRIVNAQPFDSDLEEESTHVTESENDDVFEAVAKSFRSENATRLDKVLTKTENSGTLVVDEMSAFSGDCIQLKFSKHEIDMDLGGEPSNNASEHESVKSFGEEYEVKSDTSHDDGVADTGDDGFGEIDAMMVPLNDNDVFGDGFFNPDTAKASKKKERKSSSKKRSKSPSHSRRSASSFRKSSKSPSRHMEPMTKSKRRSSSRDLLSSKTDKSKRRSSLKSIKKAQSARNLLGIDLDAPSSPTKSKRRSRSKELTSTRKAQSSRDLFSSDLEGTDTKSKRRSRSKELTSTRKAQSSRNLFTSNLDSPAGEKKSKRRSKSKDLTSTRKAQSSRNLLTNDFGPSKSKSKRRSASTDRQTTP